MSKCTVTDRSHTFSRIKIETVLVSRLATCTSTCHFAFADSHFDFRSAYPSEPLLLPQLYRYCARGPKHTRSTAHQDQPCTGPLGPTTVTTRTPAAQPTLNMAKRLLPPSLTVAEDDGGLRRHLVPRALLARSSLDCITSQRLSRASGADHGWGSDHGGGSAGYGEALQRGTRRCGAISGALRVRKSLAAGTRRQALALAG